MATSTLLAPHASFSQLLARYMRGEIGDSLWTRLMHLFDASEVSSTERLALARFVNDLVSEGGSDALFIPRDEEVRDLLHDTRN